MQRDMTSASESCHHWAGGASSDTFHIKICRDVDVPRLCHTDWSQKEKNKCYIMLLLYMESRKMGQKNLFAKQKERQRIREQMCGHQERKGWVGWIRGLTLTYIHSSRGSSQLRDWPQVSGWQADSLPPDPPGKSYIHTHTHTHTHTTVYKIDN